MDKLRYLLAEVSVGPDGKVTGTGFFQGSFLSIFTNVANFLMVLVGAISVIMVIVGGLRYTLSSGNPNSTKVAKDTVMYALIGLVVAILGYAIVTFVKNKAQGL